MAETDTKSDKPAKRKLNLSDEERRKRSERLAKLRSQGKVGPQYGKLGGRPRKPRAAELIAEEAEKNKQQLVNVLKDAIDPSQSVSTRLKGLKQWVDIEQAERQMEMTEEEHLAKMSREEMAHGLADKIANNPVLAKVLADRLNGVNPIEGNAEEVTDAEVVSEEAEDDGTDGDNSGDT